MDYRMDRQSGYRPSFAGRRDVDLAAKVMQCQTEFACIVAHATLHGWKLTGNEQYLYHDSFNALPDMVVASCGLAAGVLRRDRSTWQ